MKTGKFKIRPAGRHLLTIGRDLVQDQYAAIVELVKNAYDADSPDVAVSIELPSNGASPVVTITDHGHGMSRDVVINKWLVPSTDDKKERKRSPDGRILQGRKGIGRFAAAVLGSELLLQTVSKLGERTSLYIRWEDFESASYIDEVDVLVESTETHEESGTSLIISGVKQNFWSASAVKKLETELSKLIPPRLDNNEQDNSEDRFSIALSVKGLPDYGDVVKVIEPLTFWRFFDYRIVGTINSDGSGTLVYSNNRAKNTIDEYINFPTTTEGTGCGTVFFDIRVFDREPSALDALIQRSSSGSPESLLTRPEIRRALDENNGLSVYRNGFRIRPMGDATFDWLRLNQRRIQNPSFRISSNQLLGVVGIESEEASDLVEKSARDGLLENEAYLNLQKLTEKVIGKLEAKRFSYRDQSGIGRRSQRTEILLDKFLDLEELRTNIEDAIDKINPPKERKNEFLNIIDEDFRKREKLSEDLRRMVAIYQGQATLGKLVSVILHEGRRPLGLIQNDLASLKHFANLFSKTHNESAASSLVLTAMSIEPNVAVFAYLFAKLDPLVIGSKMKKTRFDVIKTVYKSLELFTSKFKASSIVVQVQGVETANTLAYESDIPMILYNLIDNSIYWIAHNSSTEKRIVIEVNAEDGEFVSLDYTDSGPGIEPEHIESGVIFEPYFSTKPDGTGLGLAIAGEVASRNDYTLLALEHDHGAHFRITTKRKVDDNGN